MIKTIIFVVCGLTILKAQNLPTCKSNQIDYTYTECDQEGGRWRVEIPANPDVCVIKTPAAPVRGKSCDFTCNRGQYLDVKSQKCKDCEPGSFSLGSGIRFDNWDKIPNGFHLSSESVSFEEYGYHTKVDNCSKSVWQASKDSIKSNKDDCTSSLSYAVTLKTEGTVTFWYQYTDEDVIFHFYVRNGQCQTSHKNGQNVFLNTTGTGWDSYTTKLPKGDNVLYWKTTGILVGNRNSVKPVLIRQIEITGVSYSKACVRCRPGYFADETGSSECKPCLANTFSDVGAKFCVTCNNATHYAPSMSGKCLKRPACSSSDYFETHSKCNEENKYKIMYKWMDPKVCRDDVDNAVTLPASNQFKDCAPCNPGFYPSEQGIKCNQCPRNTFSDGKIDCKKCPANTAPNYGYYYLSWDEKPSNVKVSCLTTVDGGCSADKQGWKFMGNAIESSKGQHVNAFLLLLLETGSFGSPISVGEDIPVYGKVSFAFETQCSADCTLFFMKEVTDVGTEMLESWQGSQMKQTYSYQVVEQRGVTFSWAFQKSGENTPGVIKKVANDIAKIYFINVTNVMDGFADSCKSCAHSKKKSKSSECIACPRGYYIKSNGQNCTQCQNGFVLDDFNDDPKCKKCDIGTTHNSDKTSCQQTCFYKSPLNHREYNFSGMAAPVTASTPPMFTETGSKYFHSYNFSLCGNDGYGIAECAENMSLSLANFGRDSKGKRVKGMICRSTEATTEIAGNVVLIHTKPVLLASSIKNITHAVSNSDKEIFPKEITNDREDVIFYMTQKQFEDDTVCPNGLLLAIHLRCDPNNKEIKVSMPESCPDSTCDGCTFNFLWESVEACPVCTEDDYISMEGACISGKRTTRYMWKQSPKNCKDGVSLPDYEVKKCTQVLFYVEIGLFIGVVLLLILAVLLCRMWKRSKKLEYKYHRLVHSSGKNGGELPLAETCAMTDSESEPEGDDEVMFQKKKARILDKNVNSYDSVALKPMTHGV